MKEQVDTVHIDLLDSNGMLINSFLGYAPEYVPDPNFPRLMQGGSTLPTTAKGLNTFTWDLRYPGAASFEKMIIWSARPQRGPLAPLGNYQVKIRVGKIQEIENFEIKIDPNLEEITSLDIQLQFDLSMQIRNATNSANQAVIQIRSIRNQLNKLMNNQELRNLNASVPVSYTHLTLPTNREV